MSTNARSVAIGRAGNAVSRAAPFSIQGWLILLLGTLSAGLLGSVVGAYGIDTDAAVMATVATAGYLFGFLLARTRIPDLFAHALAFLLGIVLSLAAIAPGELYDQLRSGEWRALLDRYESLLRGFVSSIDSGDKFETDIAVFALSLAIWLVAYTAAWMLFRRGWMFWSLALPGAILLVTLALDRDRPTWPALLYLGLALALAAGQTAASRTDLWNARGIAQPRRFGSRSMLLGSLIAVLAVGVGLYFSFDLDDRFKERAFDSGDRLASWVSNRFDPSSPRSTNPVLAAGNYGSFADQFKVGDGVPSGDSPIAVVQANGEEYLAARRMNEYDGTGWKSTTSQSGDGPTSLAPRIKFQSDQPIPVPREQLQHRAQDEATITLLQPGDRLLFTIDQHFSASEMTLARVGWQQIDTVYTIGQVTIADVPVDLRELIVLLQTSDVTDQGTGDSPRLVSSQADAELERIQNRLLSDYPVETELGWSDDGSVQVSVKGRLPVYSDVEAVYSANEMEGRTYSVVGLVPQVTSAELEAAGTNYPDYISQTYLGLPDSVTQETRDLANQIAQQAGASTPFDQAVAIENYLRANFTYQLDAGPAPEGRDIVDYFLFDSKVGRCDHYSSSMAVMLRTLGVPARIVTGLAPVPYDSDMSGYVYRGRNAHAWVEVYFPGFGWIQFEPTPTQSTVDLDRTGESISTPVPAPSVVPTEPSTGTNVPPAPTPSATPLPAPASIDTEGGSAGTNGPSALALGLGAGLIALGAGGTIWFWRRRRLFVGMPAARANYSRLQRLGRFMGIDAAPELTPREYAFRFGSAKPNAATGAIRVADAFTQEQYASNADAGTIARESDIGWREAKQGATDWRFWRQR